MNVVIKQYDGTKWFFVIMAEEEMYSYGNLFIPFLIVRGTEKQVE